MLTAKEAVHVSGAGLIWEDLVPSFDFAVNLEVL